MDTARSLAVVLCLVSTSFAFPSRYYGGNVRLLQSRSPFVQAVGPLANPTVVQPPVTSRVVQPVQQVVQPVTQAQVSSPVVSQPVNVVGGSGVLPAQSMVVSDGQVFQAGGALMMQPALGGVDTDLAITPSGQVVVKVSHDVPDVSLVQQVASPLGAQPQAGVQMAPTNIVRVLSDTPDFNVVQRIVRPLQSPLALQSPVRMQGFAPVQGLARANGVRVLAGDFVDHS